MCTLTIVYNVFPTTPIVVAANRDEQTNRPSTPPRRIDTSLPAIAPIDDQAGGTWIGYNAENLFVAITNRWLDTSIDPDRSRGLLVKDILSQPTIDAASTTVERSVTDDVYDGFNLLIATPAAAVLYEWTGTLTTNRLDAGVHVVMNAGFDDQFDLDGSHSHARHAQAENAAKVRTELEPRPGETPADWLDRAATVLGDHSYGLCIHADGYGTRSSSLIAINTDGTATYQYADGPPCETAYTAVNDHI